MGAHLTSSGSILGGTTGMVTNDLSEVIEDKTVPQHNTNSGIVILGSGGAQVTVKLTVNGFVLVNDQPIELNVEQGTFLANINTPEIIKEDVQEKCDLLENKIKDFANFKSPWGEDGNATPTANTIKRAIDVLEILYKWKTVPDDVYRTAEGGIAFHFNKSNAYYIIEVFPDEEILLTVEKPDSTQFEEYDLDSITNFCLFLN